MSALTQTATRDLPIVLVLLAFATSVVVAVEFIVVGLLPVLARDLEVSLAEAGWLVGAFAAAAAIVGPPLTLAASAQPPRRVLTVSLLVFAAGNLAAVLVPVYSMLLAVRIAQGAVLPVFVSVGAAAASRLAPPERRGRVVAQANIGFVIGVVVALPAGVALAEGSAWRLCFITLSALALVAAGLMAALFPAAPHAVPPAPRRQATLLLQPQFLGHLALSVVAFAAVFAAYTYLAAWLERVVGMGSHGIAAALVGFGLSGLIGNAAAARVADRAPLRATVLAVLVMATAATAATLVPDRPSWLALMVAVWGAAQMAAVTLCQVRVMLAGEVAPAFALAMNIAAANLGIALGSLAGDAVVDRWGLDAIGLGAMGLALGATSLAFLTRELKGPTAWMPAGGERCRV